MYKQSKKQKHTHRNRDGKHTKHGDRKKKTTKKTEEHGRKNNNRKIEPQRTKAIQNKHDNIKKT